MHTSLSKKLLAGLLSLVMVLSLVAPSTSAQAATKYSLTDKKSVKSGVTFKYQLKGVSKGCYVKVTRNVSGEKVVYNKKELTKTTKVNGTGKTLNLYVTYGEKDENYTGKFTVRVYGKKTNKLYKTLVEEVTVKVPEKEVKDGVTATLTNAFNSTYPNTVLVNKQAVIRVAVVKNGKPVTNETVVFNATGKFGATTHYSVVGANAAVTDANGYATFVIGNNQPNVHSDDAAEVCSVAYTATLAESGESVSGNVSFAAINLTNVLNVNEANLTASDDLIGGENAQASGTNELAITADMANPVTYDDEYVAAQQVSLKGSNEHAVTFTGGYPVITLPTTALDEKPASKKVDTINYKSDAYHVYNNYGGYALGYLDASNNGDYEDMDGNYVAGTDALCSFPSNYKIFELSEDISKLTYATANFDKISLSGESKLVIETWNSVKAAEDPATLGHEGHLVDVQVIDGEKTGSSFGYQIPLNRDYNSKWCLKVYIVSAGQVNTEMNSGYELNNITYVFKTLDAEFGTMIPLQNAKVNWSVVETPYTAEADLTNYTAIENGAADLDNYTVNGQTTPVHRLTYKVPVFPYTGDAVITQYDKNNKVVGYFAVATVNNGKNQNVIDTTEEAYAISEDELRDKVGTITNQDGTSVTVNSETSGRTTLEGKVTVDGVNFTDLDAETDSVYTSVQWNPVKKSVKEDKAAFIALIGQTITVKAQLVDANGNAVKAANQNVSFSYTDNADVKQGIANNTTSVNGYDAAGTGASSVNVTNKTLSTDKNGQATLTLKAAKAAQLLNVEAEDASKSYDVVVSVGNTTVKKADLYWIDADLAFDPTISNLNDTITTSSATPSVTSTALNHFVGETWELGVFATGKTFTKGVLKGYSPIVEGMNVNTVKASGSKVGTIENVSNGVVTVTSKQAGKELVSSKINSATTTKDVKVTTGSPVTTAFVGTGSTTINKTLVLDVEWKTEGASAEFAAIASQYSYAGTRTVYLKVSDKFGNLQNDTVYLTSDQGAASITGGYNYNTNTNTSDGGNNCQKITAAPTKTGVYPVTVTRQGTEAYTTITARVGGLSEDTVSTVIYWNDNPSADFVLDVNDKDNEGKYVASYDKSKGVIALPMTSDVAVNSVKKGQFEVKFKDANMTNAVTWAVTGVEVKGSVIYLTVPSTNSDDASATITVTYKAWTDPITGIEYKLMSDEGVTLTTNKTVTLKNDSGDSQAVSTLVSDYTNAYTANQAIAADVATLKTALESVTSGTTLTIAGTGTGTTRVYSNFAAGTATGLTGSYVAPTLTFSGFGTAGKATFDITVADAGGNGTAKVLTVTVNVSATAITSVSVAVH